MRPFGGQLGGRLIAAYEAGRHLDTLAIGRRAILSHLQAAERGEPLILDRGWVTVATLVPREVFAAGWDLWIPSALLWCDQATTLRRLQCRDRGDTEPDDWHAYFLSAYLDRFDLHPGGIVRSDLVEEPACLAELKRLYEEAAPFEMPRSQPDLTCSSDETLESTSDREILNAAAAVRTVEADGPDRAS
ncbi:MAG: hypothetical protein JWO81_1716 [Alphaproteobacteria bacterium]|nr:hypothetical protein [Alphaproteobacteria bacterium]